jgi:glucose 1-dehydrogenase
MIVDQGPRMTAIVTGAGGSGRGRAIARRLARDGAGLVVSDMNEAGGLETIRLVESEGGRAVFCHADVRKQRDVKRLVDVAIETYGDLSLLINNANAASDGGRHRRLDRLYRD